MSRKSIPPYLLFIGGGVLVLATFWLVSQSRQSKLSGVTAMPPDPTETAFAMLTFDFTPIVLTPNDVADLFPVTTYSIQQQLKGPGMQGVTVIYPTRVVEHTSAFAEGFATQIKVFADEDRTVRAFDTAVAQQDFDNILALEALGDTSRGFQGKSISPEGYELGSTEYVALIRQRNILVTITLRRNIPVPITRLSELSKLVLSRLNTGRKGE